MPKQKYSPGSSLYGTARPSVAGWRRRLLSAYQQQRGAVLSLRWNAMSSTAGRIKQSAAHEKFVLMLFVLCIKKPPKPIGLEGFDYLFWIDIQ
ncbi:MAG: hypothetical protein JXI43_11605 [Tissierellales bacterium]|nr:hypothetical protein [Tissierellales bacterium]